MYYETPMLIVARKTDADGFYFVGMGEVEYKFPLTSAVVVQVNKYIKKMKIYVNGVLTENLIGSVLKYDDRLKFKIDKSNNNSETIMQVELILKCSLLED